MSERDEFTIKTPQGERITYVEGKEGYWSATQEGMPDVWGLSRVASRAVSALRSAQQIQNKILEAMYLDEEEHTIICHNLRSTLKC